MKAIDAHRSGCHLPIGHCPRCEFEALKEDLKLTLRHAADLANELAKLEAVICREQGAT